MAQYTPLPIKPAAGTLADDGDLAPELPRICVDYLSHQWAEEDVWRSWRSMTRAKYEIANGMRLENASWRTWWKQRNKLKTISPETLNWLKDSDVTWLYGPLHQAPSSVPIKVSSAVDKLGIDLPKSDPTRTSTRNRVEDSSPSPSQQQLSLSQLSSSVSSYSSSARTPPLQARPILKKRSVTDILAMGIIAPRVPPTTSSPLYEAVTAEMEGQPIGDQPVSELVTPDGSTEHLGGDTEAIAVPGVLKASTRPPLWHTKSDSILLRDGVKASLSTSPMSIQGLSPPGDRDSAVKSASRSPPEFEQGRNGRRSDSSSSYQVSDGGNGKNGMQTKPKRHISFNSFVEQRIVVDPLPTRLPTVYARPSTDDSDSGDDDNDEYDEDDEDGETILQMRSSSGSSLSSRRGSSASNSSRDDRSLASQMTMITAPIAPTLLKEPDDLPAPSPAVVFVAPDGIDEEALKYKVHVASSLRSQFALQADRRRSGSDDWIPGSADWYEQQAEERERDMLDYFSGVPVGPTSTPPSRKIMEEPDREPIYTDEDEDAITVRRRGRIRSPRGSISGWHSPTATGESGSKGLGPPKAASETTLPSPVASRTGATRRSYEIINVSTRTGSSPSASSSISPPIVSHQEVVESPKATRGGDSSSSSSSISRNAPYVESDSAGSSSYSSASGLIVGSAPRSSNLSSSMSSMRPSSTRSAYRNRPRGASFQGVDLRGETSALSGRSSSSVSSPPREPGLSYERGRSARINEELERPRRGRSLLRTGSSSTLSERERSSTTTSSSPMGSLSPRSTSSVGIVGGYIPTSAGSVIIAPSGSLRSGSALRYESGSWTTEEERTIDGGELEQIISTHSKPKSKSNPIPQPESNPIPVSAPVPAPEPQPQSQPTQDVKPKLSGLVRTSSSSNIPGQTSLNSPSGIRRSGSSSSLVSKPGVLQRTSSSSNIVGAARPSPQITPSGDIPSLVLQPSSRKSSLTELSSRGNLAIDPFASPAESLGSHSSESTGTSWRTGELDIESPATPPSPVQRSRPPFDEPAFLHQEVLQARNAIKPRASGVSLASNGSNSSSTTIVPNAIASSTGTPGGSAPLVGSKRRSAHFASVSSSASSTTSAASMHRRSTSRSSHSVPPSTPPTAIRSTSSSSTVPTRLVTPVVVTRGEIGPSSSNSTMSASEKQLRRLSGGIGSPNAEEKSNSGSPNPSSPTSPGSVLSNVVGSAKGLLDALWGNHDHSSP
ncbi:hypothetical protein FRC16_009262 [Serendipita sp. 398]|nr:hypothetical protein FRC16_009262 [Serendipita sp. 398]